MMEVGLKEHPSLFWWIKFAPMMFLGVIGCFKTELVTRVDHRENCQVCHRPRGDDGTPRGIELAHKNVDLSCTDCHGGEGRICDGTMNKNEHEITCDGEWVYDKERAHYQPEKPIYLKNLSSAELDQVDPTYLQFINPGDLRVAHKVCGECHDDIVHNVEKSLMAHSGGELSAPRFRARSQDHFNLEFGVIPESSNLMDHLKPFQPDKLDIAQDMSYGAIQDHYLQEDCLGCHLADFGQNKHPGTFRSSGCSSCHVVYNDQGTSESKDPTKLQDGKAHPIVHEMTNKIPTNQCTHCHFRGARIGLNYQGMRESSGAGKDPPHKVSLGKSLYGHDQQFYVVDEDSRNDHDETPPDVHFQAGMDCIDCHTGGELHGDGESMVHSFSETKVLCTDCHGTQEQYPKLESTSQNITAEAGSLVLTTKIKGLKLKIPLLKDFLSPSHPEFSSPAKASMTPSHMEELECSTCHSAWLPSCYGCHVEVDVGPAKPTIRSRRQWIRLFDMVLAKNQRGKISHSMPAERFFLTLKDSQRFNDPIFKDQPRHFQKQGSPARAGFGQRPIDPHTTQLTSPFMACDRCHSTGNETAPDNQILLDITHGFGSKRFPYEAPHFLTGQPHTYYLDAIQSKDGLPLTVMEHHGTFKARPLNQQEIQAMRRIVVSPKDWPPTPIPPDAATNPDWPQ